jgi:hypothetical protein
MKVNLVDVADVIRSKNSGPYELTFDIIFREWEMFERVCSAQAIDAALIARLFGIRQEQILSIIAFRPAKAYKITIVRPLPSGDIGETDVYGAQQHAPLLGMVLDV